MFEEIPIKLSRRRVVIGRTREGEVFSHVKIPINAVKIMSAATFNRAAQRVPAPE